MIYDLCLFVLLEDLRAVDLETPDLRRFLFVLNYYKENFLGFKDINVFMSNGWLIAF